MLAGYEHSLHLPLVKSTSFAVHAALHAQFRNSRVRLNPSAYICQAISFPQSQRGHLWRLALLTSRLASSSSKYHCVKRSLQVSWAGSRRLKFVAQHSGSYALGFHSRFAAMLQFLQQAMPTLHYSESSVPTCSRRHSSALQPFQNHHSQRRLLCRSCWFWLGTASERKVMPDPLQTMQSS